MIPYLSTFSGIEAASCAWSRLGWKPVAFSEVAPDACRLLKHRFPDVPNLGDIRKFQEWPDYAIRLLCGGSPCQSFSVAGLREGLADPRGNLMLTFAAVAARYRPRWLVWENVYGVLSSDGGRDFAALLGLLTGQSVQPPVDGWQNSGVLPGYRNAYGIAWTTLDAQYFGVAQRRRRVFLVGCLGDWARAAAVLFDASSLSGHPAPSRAPGQDVAGTLSARTSGGGGLGTDFESSGGLIPETVSSLLAQANKDGFGRPPGSTVDTIDQLIPVAYRTAGDGDVFTEGDVVAPLTTGTDASANIILTPTIYDSTQVTSATNRSNPQPGDPCHSLAADAKPPLLAYNVCFNDANGVRSDRPNGGCYVTKAEVTPALTLTDNDTKIVHGRRVRRLTPLECERLQGFPDNWTKIPIRHFKHCKITTARPEYRWEPDGKGGWWLMESDGARYRMIGNSWAVPVPYWIGERINQLEEMENG